MKCPKCHYLGFETGDRCRNCGYDFSLLAVPEAPQGVGDLPLRTAPVSPADDSDVPWDEDLDLSVPAAPAAPATVEAVTPERSHTAATRLPLFSGASHPDDEPLITVVPAPRRPIAVRKAPELPRLRSVTPRSVRPAEEPALEFPELPDTTPSPAATPRAPLVPKRSPRLDRADGPASCPPGPRAAAATLDLALLLAIDLVVLYFTLRMASLPMSGWRLIPLAPLVTFLLIIKLTYFAAFTAVGGQTIGKMAARIRVVSDDDEMLSPARAFRRALGAVASLITFGATFAPALVGDRGQALHDRLARTRVVPVRAA